MSKGRASPTNKTAQSKSCDYHMSIFKFLLPPNVLFDCLLLHKFPSHDSHVIFLPLEYLNDVRQRRSSQSESDDSATERGGPPSPSRSPAGTNQAHTFTRKPRNVPVRPVIPGQAPPRKARVPPGIENDELSALKVKKWDPSKMQHNSDEEDEEEEIAQPAKRWQVKQVPNNDGVPIVNKWKVKQVPETGPGEEGQDATQEKERKWKVKQVPDSTVPPKEEREEEEEEIPNLRRKWKVKQVPDRHDKEEEEEEEEEEVPLQRKWKVKQVHNVEGGGEAVPQQRKWKVKQVHDNQEDEEVQPQKIWKVKQVPDHHGNEEEEEEEELPQRKWAVKQVPETGNDTRETTPTQEVKRKGTYTLEDEEVGVADEEEGEGLHPKLERKGTYTAVPDTGEGEGEGEGGEGEEGEGDGEKKQATVKRSGTFTKDKPKVYARRPDNECGRDSSASDRTMSPVEAENLKIKWTPRNPSPASGDEGKRTRTQSPASPRGSPDQQIRGSRYSDYQAQIRQQPSVGGGRGQLRSPVTRQGLPSPLRQQRQAEGGMATSSYVSPNKQVTPRLRPPSPRRSSQLPSNSEETTPTRVMTNQTTPTSHTSRTTGNQTMPTGQTPRSVGPSPRGGKVKGTSPGGIKLAKPLSTSPQALPQGRVSQPAQQPQKRRVLPAAQSTKGMSPRGGAKALKPQRGGGEGRTRTGTRPSPSSKQDDSWLDECF